MLMTSMPGTKRQKYELIRGGLELERSSFLEHWKDLGNFILPRRPRFTVTDANRGDRRNQKIIDSSGTLASRTLRSGLMSGVTSPARPWFRLTVSDQELAKVMAVKQWLEDVTERMTSMFLRSNLYNSLPIIYGDVGTFATAAMLVEEDFETVIRTYTFPIGSYMIGNSDRGKVEVFFREWRWTVRQVVQKFGKKLPNGDKDWRNFSSNVRQLWESNQRDAWVDICHIILPNDEYDQQRVESKFKKFTSCYYEKGVTGSGVAGYQVPTEDVYLSESGYDSFPVLVPRWEVTGEDVYGTDCPGMTTLGDIKQLQTGERRSMQAVDKMVNPPMTGPSSMRTRKASTLPGDLTYVDTMQGQQGFVPAYQVDPRIRELEEKQAQARLRIQRGWFEDLFLMLASSDRRQITAREVDERHEEKLLALGPVLEQLNQDLLDPLIDRGFEIMVRQQLLPEPPDELRGIPLRVEYVSIMAQAQKLVGIANLERFDNFVNLKAAVDPSILDKIDGDKLAEKMGDGLSIPAGVIRDQDQVDAIRDQRAQAAAAQQQVAAAEQASKAAKNLAATPTTGDTALTELMNAGKAGALAPQ